jgi:hypothetical protein
MDLAQCLDFKQRQKQNTGTGNLDKKWWYYSWLWTKGKIDFAIKFRARVDLEAE